MSFQIDQSGKIEDTAKNTVIAFSNDIQASVFISKKTKRQVQEAFRYHGEISFFIDQIFALAVFYLISDFIIEQKITIDLEYPGRDKFITRLINEHLKSHNKPPHDISFGRIGSKPKVHYAAKDVFDNKIKPTKILTLKQILDKQKDRWALKRVSFNPGRRSGPGPVRTSISKKHKKSR